jgi:hypothetical protein
LQVPAKVFQEMRSTMVKVSGLTGISKANMLLKKRHRDLDREICSIAARKSCSLNGWQQGLLSYPFEQLVRKVVLKRRFFPLLRPALSSSVDSDRDHKRIGFL